MPPKFIYFDLGKVLIDFSMERMYRQMGEVAGIAPAEVQAALASGLQLDYETGRLDSRGAHEVFCRQTGTRPDYKTFSHACNDIFTPISSMWAVVSELYQAGYHMGILSNTCEGHWSHCRERFELLRAFFTVYALSFEIKAVKPEAAIFCKAAELAGCQPEEIFYTDDIAGHVAGARAAGFDAVLFTSADALAKELRKRGVAFNY